MKYEKDYRLNCSLLVVKKLNSISYSDFGACLPQVLFDMIKGTYMVKNNRVQSNKNMSSIRTSAWVISLFIQFLAVVIMGIASRNFGFIGIGIIILVAIGYAFLVIRTIRLIRGKIIDTNSISVLTAIHLVAFLVSIFVIAVFIAFYYGTKF